MKVAAKKNRIVGLPDVMMIGDSVIAEWFSSPSYS